MQFFSAEHTQTLKHYHFNITYLIYMCLKKKKVIIFYFKRMYSQMRLC